MFWVRRGRPAWAVPVLLFLAVLIVSALAFNLANLDTGGEAIPDVPDAGGTPPTGVGVIAQPASDLLLIVLAGATAVGAVALTLRKRTQVKRPLRPSTWWEMISSLVGLVVVIAFLVAWPRMMSAVRGGANASNPAGTGDGGSPVWPTAAGAPIGVFLALAVFAAILGIAYLLRRGSGLSRFESDESVEGPEERRAAAHAVRSAIDELELGGDVRTVILACFERFCGLLGARGITAQVALTPRELEGLAVRRLNVSRDASETLTSVFEEARYSEHPLGEADRSRAIESLARIRAALEA